MANKYYEHSPYTYSANSPIIFVDYDGRDYGLTFDFKNKTVTVSATYFALKKDSKEAQRGINYWNNQNGKYKYSYKDENGDTHELDVKFDLKLETVEAEGESQSGELALDEAVKNGPAGESNIFMVVQRLQKDDYGVTLGGNKIAVIESRKNTETVEHEFGHSLGLGHTKSGLMTASASDSKRSLNMTKSYINTIVYFPIKSTPDDPTKAQRNDHVGRATIHFKNNTAQNSPQSEKDYKKFRRGTVKSKS